MLRVARQNQIKFYKQKTYFIKKKIKDVNSWKENKNLDFNNKSKMQFYKEVVFVPQCPALCAKIKTIKCQISWEKSVSLTLNSELEINYYQCFVT